MYKPIAPVNYKQLNKNEKYSTWVYRVNTKKISPRNPLENIKQSELIDFIDEKLELKDLKFTYNTSHIVKIV